MPLERRRPEHTDDTTTSRPVRSAHTPAAVFIDERLECLNDNEDGGGRCMMPRRRSSNISFERHGSVVMEHLLALVDDDDRRDARVGDEDEGSLDGIPTPEETPNDEHNNNMSTRSVLTEIEDGIIEEGMRSGRLHVDMDDDDDDVFDVTGHASFSSFGLTDDDDDVLTTTMGHASFSSFGSTASGQRRGSSSSSLMRRAQGRRRASFSRRGFATSASSSASSSSASSPNLHNDISVALRELTTDDDDEEEEHDDAAIARAVLATTTTVPPVRSIAADAGPRRSSLKRPGLQKDWSGRSLTRGRAA